MKYLLRVSVKGHARFTVFYRQSLDIDTSETLKSESAPDPELMKCLSPLGWEHIQPDRRLSIGEATNSPQA
jgi:hypothetical protein